MRVDGSVEFLGHNVSQSVGEARRGGTHGHLPLAIVELASTSVGAVNIPSTLLLDVLERFADLLELALVDRVFERTTSTILDLSNRDKF